MGPDDARKTKTETSFGLHSQPETGLACPAKKAAQPTNCRPDIVKFGGQPDLAVAMGMQYDAMLAPTEYVSRLLRLLLLHIGDQDNRCPPVAVLLTLDEPGTGKRAGGDHHSSEILIGKAGTVHTAYSGTPIVSKLDYVCAHLAPSSPAGAARARLKIESRPALASA